MEQFIFRVNYKDEIRIIRVNREEVTLDNLHRRIFKVFPWIDPNFNMKYQDPFPGLVSVSSNEEFEELINHAPKSPLILLFLFDSEEKKERRMENLSSPSLEVSDDCEENAFVCTEINTDLSNEEIEAQIRELEDRAYFETEERRKKANSLEETADALRWESQILSRKSSSILKTNQEIQNQVKYEVLKARRVIYSRNVRRILFERQQAKGRENNEKVEQRLSEGLDNWFGGKEERSVDPFCSSAPSDINNIPSQVLDDIYRSQGRSANFFASHDPEDFLEMEEEACQKETQTEDLKSHDWFEEEEAQSEEESEEESDDSLANDYNFNDQYSQPDFFEERYNYEELPSLASSSLAASTLTLDPEDDDEDEEEEIDSEKEELEDTQIADQHGDLLEFKEEEPVKEEQQEQVLEKEVPNQKSEAIEIKKNEPSISPSISPLTSPQRDRRDGGFSPKKPFLLNFLSSIFDSKGSNQKSKEIILPAIPNKVSLESEKVKEDPIKMEDLESSNASYESSLDNYSSGNETSSSNESLEESFGSDVSIPASSPSQPDIPQPFEETNTSVLYEQPPQPPQEKQVLYASSLQLLNEMGWKDVEKNDLLLEKYAGDISEVIRELLEM